MEHTQVVETLRTPITGFYKGRYFIVELAKVIG